MTATCGGLGQRIDRDTRAREREGLLRLCLEALGERREQPSAQPTRGLAFGDAPLVVAKALWQIEPLQELAAEERRHRA